MKKICLLLILIPGILSAQVSYQNSEVRKAGAQYWANGTGGGIKLNATRIYESSGNLILDGGSLNLSTNSLLGTGSIGGNTSRILKGWFTNLELTNLPTIANVSIFFNPAFTGIPTAPTATPLTSTTQLATTSFVTTADNLKLDSNDSTIYTSDHRGDVIEADLADFETIPDWVVTFVIGGGNPNDSLAFADSTIRSFPNYTGKVMHVTKVNVVLGHGEGLDTLGFQIQWHSIFKSASSTKLWNLPLPVGRPNCYTIGTTSTTFANDLIPVDARVVLTIPYIPADHLMRKPVYAEITMSGHYN